jgi:hypothetical protein
MSNEGINLLTLAGRWAGVAGRDERFVRIDTSKRRLVSGETGTS